MLISIVAYVTYIHFIRQILYYNDNQENKCNQMTKVLYMKPSQQVAPLLAPV